MTEHSAKAVLRPVRSSDLGEVALVAFGDSMHLMYDLSPEVPIWTLNAAESYDFPRIDALFEMHRLRDLVLETHRIENLKKEHDYPIFMLKEYPFFPASVAYPVEAIADAVFQNVFLGPKNAKYFDSSLPYMMALAVMAGYTQIDLIGFGLMTDTEYVYQRPGAFGLTMWAAGKGVKVVLPEDTQLMPDTLYGFEDYQSISRQNCEQWLQDMMVQESDWMGKMNLFHERVVQMEKYGAPEEDIQKAQADRQQAYHEMYMRQGAIHLLRQQIAIMDRKRDALADFEFKDHLFFANDNEEMRTKEQAENK